MTSPPTVDAPSTSRKRVSTAVRKTLILQAARKLFAERGYEGTRTSQISKAAGTSEALLYRHFPSKEALYRAVLRQMIIDQNRNYDQIGLPAESAESLIVIIRDYLRDCIATPPGGLREENRIMLSSLAGDGRFASQIFRRARRIMQEPLARAFAAARAAGDMDDSIDDPAQAALLIDHVGSMLMAGRSVIAGPLPYGNDVQRLLDDAVWFCCRGIGLSDEAIARSISLPSGTAGKVARARNLGQKHSGAKHVQERPT